MNEIIEQIQSFGRDGLAMAITFGGIGTGAFLMSLKSIVSKSNKDDADVLSLTLINAKKMLKSETNKEEIEKLKVIITNLESRIAAATPIIKKIKEKVTSIYE